MSAYEMSRIRHCVHIHPHRQTDTRTLVKQTENYKT